MKVPFTDLKAGYEVQRNEINAAIARVLDSGWYILGDEVDAFERQYAEYCQASHCVGVANGFDALHLALRALGVGPGDEVIVPSNTYIATWLAVSQCGATPIPVEPDLATFNMDPALVEAAITSRTKVILPVHLYGQPADMDSILDVARQHGLKVLEDGAQAHGARYKGQRIGAHGDMVAWSFYPGKNLGAYGDGGAITTNSLEFAERVRMLRNYGSRMKHVNEIRGFNSRLDALQAAVLSVRLRNLDQANQLRSEIARRYLVGLESTNLTLPTVAPWADPVWHLFVVRSRARDTLQRKLDQAEIGNLIHYPIAPHLQVAYADLGYSAGAFPLSEKIHQNVLSLPMFPSMTQVQVEYVIEVLREVVEA